MRVVHRGDTLSTGIKYWILPDFENRVKDGSITLSTGTTVSEFKTDVTLLRGPSGATTEHANDAVFTLIGYEADTRFLGGCGIAVDPATGAPVHDPATMETGVKGLYVAGGMVGGRFNNKIFIENGRRHGGMIVRSITGRA